MFDDKLNWFEYNWGKYVISLLLVCLGIFYVIKIIYFIKKFFNII